MKKVLLIVIVIIILFTPIKYKLRDGGSVEYKAIVYKVILYNKLESENVYLKGKEIYLLNKVIYKDSLIENNLYSNEITIDLIEVEKDSIIVKIKNNTKYLTTFTEEYKLFKLSGNKKINLRENKNCIFNEMAAQLEALDAAEIKIDFKNCYRTLKPGKYRLEKTFFITGNANEKEVVKLDFTKM